MKSICLSWSLILFNLVILFSSISSHAQVGWKWGVGSSVSRDTMVLQGFDFEVSAIDRSGNIYVGGEPLGDTTVLGPFSIASNNIWQLIIAKIDSSGNYQWAI